MVTYLVRKNIYRLFNVSYCDILGTSSYGEGGGRVERRCWVNFQCRGVLLVWMIVGQGPIALAVGAGGGCLDIFLPHLSILFSSPSLWETARYRLKYRLKGPLNPKQPTNQSYGEGRTNLGVRLRHMNECRIFHNIHSTMKLMFC